MPRSKSRKSKVSTLLSHAFLSAFSVLMLVPLVWMISTALKSRQEVFSQIPNWIPSSPVWSNFVEAWDYIPFARYYLNTFIIAFGLLFVQLITISLAAYAFARMEFRGKAVLFMLFLTQMMLTAQSTVVPNYLTISKLGLLDTYVAVAAPYFATALGVFMLRQTFLVIPKEIEHAARLDGCSGLRFLWHIALPLSKPTLLAFSIISISYHWNEFFWPLIVTDTPRARTLTIGLGIFAQSAEGGAEWTLLMAATLIVVAPIIVLFFIFQKRFVSSFMQSGLKG
jgi:sn-glycerol 3-phosphate transport system permease protein